MNTAPDRNLAPEMSINAATWRGVLTSLLILVPAAVLNEIAVSNADDAGRGGIGLLFFGVMLFGGAAGGFGVRRIRPDAALSRSALAAAGAYGIIQGAGAAKRLIAGEPTPWIGYVFLALSMATVGMAGGMLALRWMRTNGLLVEEDR